MELTLQRVRVTVQGSAYSAQVQTVRRTVELTRNTGPFIFEQLATAPADPFAGRAYFDTALGALGVWSGSDWVYLYAPWTVEGLQDLVADMFTDSQTVRFTYDGEAAELTPSVERKISGLVVGTQGQLGADASGLYVVLGFSGLEAMPGSARLDQLAAPAAALTLAGYRIINLGDPTGAQDAVTLAYLSAVQAAQTTALEGYADAVGDSVLGAAENYADAVVAAALAALPVLTASGGLERVTNDFRVADDGVTNAKLANMAADTLKGRANGAGTGDPQDLTAAQAKVVLGIKDPYAANIGDGVATSYVVTHNLGTYDVAVAVFPNADPRADEVVDVERTTTNSVTVRFANAPAVDAYRVIVRA